MRSATVRAIARWTLERRADKRNKNVTPADAARRAESWPSKAMKTIRASIKTGLLGLTPMSSEFPNLFDLELREPSRIVSFPLKPSSSCAARTNFPLLQVFPELPKMRRFALVKLVLPVDLIEHVNQSALLVNRQFGIADDGE